MSALARELARRGVLAIDPDHDPQLAYWEDRAGQRVCGPPCPGAQWLGSHRWVWIRGRMEEIVAGQDQAQFVCGIARNQDDLLDLFDRVFLLHIDGPTQQARLDHTMHFIRPAAARRAGARSAMAGPCSRRRCAGVARSSSTPRRRRLWSLTSCSPSWPPRDGCTATCPGHGR
jgi:hypothetical protein